MKSDRERQIYDMAYMWSLLKKDTNELIYTKKKKKTDSQT